MFIPSYTRFTKDKDTNTFQKRYIVQDSVYRVIIPVDDWHKTIHNKIIRWINTNTQCLSRPFPFGTIQYEEHITPDMVTKHACEKCGKIFQCLKNKLGHMKICTYERGMIVSTKTEERNIRTEAPITHHIENQNVYIQNNIELRDLGKENPNWLTTTLLHQVMDNIYRAIPTLMEKKHFNDEFPENKNLRLASSRDINKRFQVYANGRWRLRDSKQTFYKVLVDIYEVMSDALSEDEDDDDVPDKIKEFQRSERFLRKIRRIRPIWKTFQDKMNEHDQEIMNEYWEDLKTLLLDKQLGIEQGFD